MQYFEIQTCYCNLIKADTEEEAIKIYQEIIADLDENELERADLVKEYSHKEAFERIKKLQCENIEEGLEVVKYFHGKEKGAVIIDSSLV